MKNVLNFKQFLLEKYGKKVDESNQLDKEILIRPVSKEEAKEFVSSTYAADKPEHGLIDSIEYLAKIKTLHGAFEGNKLLGIVSYKDSNIAEGYTEIDIMFVDPDQRSKGIGKLLIQYVRDSSKHKKLITNPYTQESEEFFLKNGFKIDSEIDPNDTNSLVLENDDYEDSAKALNKYGMMDDDLPKEILDLVENSDDWFEDEDIWNNMLPKTFNCNLHESYAVGLGKSKEGSFPRNIILVIDTGDRCIEIERSPKDLEDIKKCIQNISEILYECNKYDDMSNSRITPKLIEFFTNKIGIRGKITIED